MDEKAPDRGTIAGQPEFRVGFQGPRALYVPKPNEVTMADGVTLVEPAAAWTRPAAAFVVDLSERALKHELLGDQPNFIHGTYLSRFSDAEVFGHHHLHAVIHSGDQFDCQDIEGYERRLHYHVDNHPGRDLPIPQITRENGKFYIDRSKLRDVEVTRLRSSVFFATPIEPLNWGMWILHAVRSASIFLETRRAERFMAYVGRDWQRALLAVVGVKDRDIAHHELGATYRCDEVIMAQYTKVDLMPSQSEREGFDRLKRTIAPDANPGARRKIFLSRRSVTRSSNGQYRALLNEEELVAALESRGFEIHEPETLPFADQIRLFAEADLVVGLGGAALFNVVFCRPGARVVSIESGAAFVHGHATLFAAAGHRYGIIFGKQDLTDPSPVHKRWTLDVPGALAAIEGFS